MQERKITNRAQRAQETKEKIYESAKYLFGKYAVDEVTINSIVERAGVAKGSFYVHFDSKDTLIASLVSDYVKRVDTDYQTYLASLSDDIKISEVFMLMIGKIADVISETIGCDAMKALYKVHLSKDANTSAALDYNRDVYKIFNYLLTKGIEQGEFRSDISVDTLTRHYIVAFRGICYEWCVRYPNYNLKQQALEHFKICIAGIII